LNETLGKLHFWMTFAGVYAIFMPLHWVGLLTQSHVLGEAQRAAIASAGSSIRTFVTLATVWTVLAQTLFVINFLYSLLRTKWPEENNPWRATTLEWSIASPAPPGNFGDTPPVVYRGAYEFRGDSELDFVPQHLAPGLPAQKVH